jgi:hypothetical protein
MTGQSTNLADWLGLVSRRPLRVSGEPGRGSTADQRGFWCGVAEAAAEMERLLGVEPMDATAFGGNWMAARLGEGVVAPAIPVAATPEEQQAAGGAYRTTPEGDVLLDGGLGEVPVLTREASHASPRVELVWFDDMARWTVGDGVLEIQDLFSRLRVAATRERLEHQLVRRRRVAPTILESVVLSEDDGPARLAVARPSKRRLTPEGLLGARLDLEGVRIEGGTISADHVAGTRLQFQVTATDADCWCLECTGDPRGIESISVSPERVEAHLATDRDPLTPGLRMRMAFDLRADLMAAFGQKV